MHPRLALALLCLLIPTAPKADPIPGTESSALDRRERFLRWTEERRLEDTVKLERTRLDAEALRQRQLDAIEARRIRLRVEELEASRVGP